MKRFLCFVGPVLLLACLHGCEEGGNRGDGNPPPPPLIDALFNHGLEKLVTNAWDGSDWFFNGKSLYVYAPGKRLIAAEGGAGPEASWKPAGGHAYSYDADGRLETDVRFFCDAEDVRQEDLQWWYLYNAAGQLETTACYYEVGGSWLPSIEREHAYDAFGRLQSKTEYDATGTPRYPVYQFVYAYDVDNRVTTQTDYQWSGAVWLPYHRVIWTYDLGGAVLEETDGQYDGATFTPSYRKSYSYDAEQRVQTMTEFTYFGGLWEAWDRNTYNYGTSGGLQNMIMESKDGGVWVESRRYDYFWTEYGSSYLLEGSWYPEPLAQWILDYYGKGEVNRYRW